MTDAMMDAIKAVAKRHNSDVRGVACIAAAMGNGIWRGCIAVTEYDPSRDRRKPRWKPAAYEFHRMPKREMPDFDWEFDFT